MRTLLYSACLLCSLNSFAQQAIDTISSVLKTEKDPLEKPANMNILMINPIHIAEGNYTLSYLRFVKPMQSYKIMLSGSEKENYVAAAFDWNFYPASPSTINYYIGGSLMGYEAPIETGVPISKPFYNFFESDKDEYNVSMQAVNGVLFRVTPIFTVTVDGKIGPALNVTTCEWQAIWSLNLNLGISF